MTVRRHLSYFENINEELAFTLLLTSTAEWYSARVTGNELPICLSVPHSSLKSFVNKTPRHLNCSPLGIDAQPRWSNPCFIQSGTTGLYLQNLTFSFRGKLRDHSFPLSCGLLTHAEGHGLKKSTEPHHL